MTAWEKEVLRHWAAPSRYEAIELMRGEEHRSPKDQEEVSCRIIGLYQGIVRNQLRSGDTIRVFWNSNHHNYIIGELYVVQSIGGGVIARDPATGFIGNVLSFKDIAIISQEKMSNDPMAKLAKALQDIKALRVQGC